MNKLQKKIKVASQERNRDYQKMLDTSRALIKATGLNPRDIEQMKDLDIVLNIPGYTLIADCLHLGGWVTVLLVRDNNGDIPDHWFRKDDGTCSCWYPPADELEKIIGLITKEIR